MEVGDCKTALRGADNVRAQDHGLSRDEYFHFVQALSPFVDPGMLWPSELKAYGNLPNEVKEMCLTKKLACSLGMFDLIRYLLIQRKKELTGYISDHE